MFCRLRINFLVSLPGTFQFIPGTFKSKSRTRKKGEKASRCEAARAATEELWLSHRASVCLCVSVGVCWGKSSAGFKLRYKIEDHAPISASFKYVDHFIPPLSGFPGPRTNPFCPLLSCVLASKLQHRGQINWREKIIRRKNRKYF